MRVVIKQWVPVGVWKWRNISETNDVCGICRVQFEGTCPSCVKPGIQCPPVSGECTHAFHRHCVQKWLQLKSSEGRCPMCRQPFTCPELPLAVLPSAMDSSEVYDEEGLPDQDQDQSLVLELP